MGRRLVFAFWFEDYTVDRGLDDNEFRDDRRENKQDGVARKSMAISVGCCLPGLRSKRRWVCI